MTYASHGTDSAARKGDRFLRGPLPPTQPVNEFFHAMREDWDNLTHTQRVDNVRASLLVIADPVSELNDFDRSTLAGLTLGELYHARLVLLRLLPYLTAATDVERP
jgi:hypothetical protein